MSLGIKGYLARIIVIKWLYIMEELLREELKNKGFCYIVSVNEKVVVIR